MNRRPLEVLPQAGFSLIELVISLILSVGLLTVVLTAFASTNELARSHISLAESQQSGRIAMHEVSRLVRMAGRGGLNGRLIPDPAGTPNVVSSSALEVRDNVGFAGTSTEVLIGWPASPTAIYGSDILTVRGVMNGTMYQLAIGSSFTLMDQSGVPATPDTAAQGALLVRSVNPAGLAQDLEKLLSAVEGGQTVPLLLVSSDEDNIHAVVQLTNVEVTAEDDSGGPQEVRLRFNIQSGSMELDGYRSLYNANTPGLPAALRSVSLVGVVEEHRFFVRESYSVAGDTSSEVRHKLAVMRVLPGSEAPMGDISSATQDVVDDISAFQVALGFLSILGPPPIDRNNDGQITIDDQEINESTTGDNDDWLFNGPSDDPTDPAQPWGPPWDDDPVTPAPPQPKLIALRISALVRSDRPDPGYFAPQVTQIENAIYSDPGLRYWNSEFERHFRRQLVRTVVEPRNL